MAEAINSAFTSDDKYFGHCNSNGKFRIWETATGVLKQEFTPNLHLTSPCTCLTWISTSRNHGKKRKSLDKSLDTEDSLDVAALGTASGSILLYSLATGTDEGQLVGGHSSTVNHLTWSRGTNLFSCGDDKLIVEWNIGNKQIESKWKAGKERVSCILVFPDGKSLLSANTSISWWDLQQKRVLKTFRGHASPVMALTLALGANSGGDGGYFVSAARDDRYLNAWTLSTTNGNKEVVASFVVEDAPLNVTVSNSGGSGPTTMGVVTRGGVLQIFRHQLNGKSAKPLKPKLTVMVAMDTGQDKAAQVNLIRFVDAHLNPEGSILIAYGTASLLSFETIDATNRDRVLCLVRKDRRKQAANNSESASKVKIPETGEGVTYVSGVLTPHSVKRGAMGKVQSEVPMEHRLQSLTLNKADVEVKTPQTNSMAELLVQGLRSTDKRMLQNVLMRREPEIINNTVKQLPVQAIAPLIQELSRIINCKAVVSKTAVSWLKCVLITHAGQLLAAPDLGATFSEVLGAVEARLQVLPPLARLRGRLDLMMEQIGTAKQADCADDDHTLLVYQDPDSSEDGSDIEDRLFHGSESGDDSWDDQSVIDDASDAAEIQDDVEMSEV